MRLNKIIQHVYKNNEVDTWSIWHHLMWPQTAVCLPHPTNTDLGPGFVSI